MIVKILGAESMGVRGLSCSVELENRKIFIDPGIALGWSRHGLLPHPFQIAMGSAIRERIIEELKDADDLIISHFDGDHCPLEDANPYQLGIRDVKNSLTECRIWAKGPENSSSIQQKRRKELAEAIERELPNAEGVEEGDLELSFPVPHGTQGKEVKMVMMSKIEEDGRSFVHASDIQFLDEKTIERILDWKPNVVLASGPPLYRFPSSAFREQRERAWKNAIKLAESVDNLIIDHHLLRSEEGIVWLNDLRNISENNVCCAADFMGREPLYLEAWRKELYEWLPVRESWHEEYAQGEARVDDYRIKGWEILISKGKTKPCKWYYCCPVREFTDAGKLERYWIENYCLVSNRNCIRYHMEERDEYHPDNMLPDGRVREGL